MSAPRHEDSKLLQLGEALETASLSEEPTLALELAARYQVSEEDAADCLEAVRVLRQALGDDAPSLVAAAPDLPEDYEILGELGRGGMGIVYRARQRSLDRAVAVKVLRPGEALFRDALRRFEREARSLAKLRHPHIVGIHEVGRAGDNLFYSMDLIEGSSLAEILAKGPLTPTQAARWLRQVAGAIAATHAHGLIHRDLKPGNILIDKGGDALVVDFGLARSLEAPTDLTGTGAILGTPAYMSPEQAAGEHEKVGEATDIYALGVILYECVTGKRPFDGKLAATLDAVIRSEPAAPRKVKPSIPVELELVIETAMAKEPAERYPSARALEEDLGRFEGGEPIRAKRPPLWARVKRRARRHRRLLSGGGALALLLVSLSWMTLDYFLVPGSRELVDEARRLLDRGEPQVAAYVAEQAVEAHGFSGSLLPKAADSTVWVGAIPTYAPRDALAAEVYRVYVQAVIAASRELRGLGRRREAEALILRAWEKSFEAFRYGRWAGKQQLAWRRLGLLGPDDASPGSHDIWSAFISRKTWEDGEDPEATLRRDLRSMRPLWTPGDPEEDLAVDALFRAMRSVNPSYLLRNLSAIELERAEAIQGRMVERFGRYQIDPSSRRSYDVLGIFKRILAHRSRTAAGKARVEAELRALLEAPGAEWAARMLARELLVRLLDLPMRESYELARRQRMDASYRRFLLEREVPRFLGLIARRAPDEPWPYFEASRRYASQELKSYRGERSVSRSESGPLQWVIAHSAIDLEALTRKGRAAAVHAWLNGEPDAVADLRRALGAEGQDPMPLIERLAESEDPTEKARLHHLLRALTDSALLPGDPAVLQELAGSWRTAVRARGDGPAPALRRRLRLAEITVAADATTRIGWTESRALSGLEVSITHDEDQALSPEELSTELRFLVPGGEAVFRPRFPEFQGVGLRSYLLRQTVRAGLLPAEGAKPDRLKLYGEAIVAITPSTVGFPSMTDEREVGVDRVLSLRGIIDSKGPGDFPIGLTLLCASEDMSERAWTLDDWRAAIARDLEGLAREALGERPPDQAKALGARYLRSALRAVYLPSAASAAAAERLVALDPERFPRLPIAHQLREAAEPFDLATLDQYGDAGPSLIALIGARARSPELRRSCLDALAARLAKEPERHARLISALRGCQARGLLAPSEALAATLRAEKKPGRGKLVAAGYGIVALVYLFAIGLLLRSRSSKTLAEALAFLALAILSGLSFAALDLGGLRFNAPIFALTILAGYAFLCRGDRAWIRTVSAVLALAVLVELTRVITAPELIGVGALIALPATLSLMFYDRTTAIKRREEARASA